MKANILLIGAIFFLSGGMIGCQPKTPVEKVKDKVEDATHEMGQAIERAGEKIKDAAH